MVRRLVFLACLGLACTLRGDGERVLEERELPGFTVVEVFNNFVTTVVVDPTLAADAPVDLTVSADGNALRRILTVLHGEATLSISVDPNLSTRLSLTAAIELTVPALRRGYATDATVLEVIGAQGELSLEARESANLSLSGGQGVTLTAAAHERATLILAGDGPTLTLEAHDAATIDAHEFRAAAVTVYARGEGDIRVCATESITIRGAGAEFVSLDCG